MKDLFKGLLIISGLTIGGLALAGFIYRLTDIMRTSQEKDSDDLLDGVDLSTEEGQQAVLDRIYRQAVKPSTNILLRASPMQGIVNIDLTRGFELNFNRNGKLVVVYAD